MVLWYGWMKESQCLPSPFLSHKSDSWTVYYIFNIYIYIHSVTFTLYRNLLCYNQNGWSGTNPSERHCCWPSAPLDGESLSDWRRDGFSLQVQFALQYGAVSTWFLSIFFHILDWSLIWFDFLLGRSWRIFIQYLKFQYKFTEELLILNNKPTGRAVFERERQQSTVVKAKEEYDNGAILPHHIIWCQVGHSGCFIRVEHVNSVPPHADISRTMAPGKFLHSSCSE